MSFESFNPRNQSEDLKEEVEYIEVKAFEYYKEQFEHHPKSTIETILKDGQGNISEVLSFVFNKQEISNTKNLDKSLNYIIQNSETIRDNILKLLEYRKDLPDYLKTEWNDFVRDLMVLLNEDFGVTNFLDKSKSINYEDIPSNTEFKLAIKKGQYETTKTEGTRVIKLLHIIKIYSKDPRVKTLIKEMKIAT